jgi:hypothetical protein
MRDLAKLALLLGVVLAPLAGCDARESAAEMPAGRATSAPLDAAASGVMLIFEEQEAGIEPYKTRFIVTDRYLRIDDGHDGPDFILMDRLLGRVYSSNSADQSVLVIESAKHEVESPLELTLTEERLSLESPPAVAGGEAQHHVYLVNGERCYDVISVPGLLDPVVAAMREYRQILASEHKRVLPYVPADMHQGCDLARNVFAPARHLSHGLPIQEWRPDGYRRSLLDFDSDYYPDPALFTLPEDYRQYTMGVGTG